MNINDYAFNFINTFNNVIISLGKNGQPAYLNLEGFIARDFAGNKDCNSSDLARARILMYLIITYLNIHRNNSEDLAYKYDQYFEMSMDQLVANCFLNKRTVENGMSYLFEAGFFEKCRNSSFKGRNRIRLAFNKLSAFIERIAEEATSVKNDKLKVIREHDEAIKEEEKARRIETRSKWNAINSIIKTEIGNNAIDLIMELGFTKKQSALMVLLSRSIYTFRDEYFEWNQVKFNTLMCRLNDRMLPEDIERDYLEKGIKYPAVEELTRDDMDTLVSSCMPENDCFHEERLLDTIIRIFRRGNLSKYYEGPKSLNWEIID